MGYPSLGTYLTWSWRRCRARRRVFPCWEQVRSHLPWPPPLRWPPWFHRILPSCGAWRRCCSSRHVDSRCSTGPAGNRPRSTARNHPVHWPPVDRRTSWSPSIRPGICCNTGWVLDSIGYLTYQRCYLTWAWNTTPLPSRQLAWGLSPFAASRDRQDAGEWASVGAGNRSRLWVRWELLKALIKRLDMK